MPALPMELGKPLPAHTRWPEFAHVIFDCDSTLSTVEGIDVLASNLGFEDEVAALTQAAMEGDVELNAVYAERLRMLRPSKQAITELRAAYKGNVVPHAREIVAALIELDVEVYVVSGGLADPVRDFAISLGINPENVRAVEARHDALSGEWWKAGERPVDQEYAGFEDGALTRSDGKAEIIADLLAGSEGSAMLVGDGASDMEAATSVDLFVGFGGVVHRNAVAEAAPIYITGDSLAPILPLAMGPGGGARLHGTAALETFEQGVAAIRTGDVRFDSAETKRTLLAALDRSPDRV
ncbi:MAG: HAD-IB family phosphatase [Acidimicrobiia bacterium]|nr:HAD-IB family phosphatase [Acidimicrobiia bacterium]